MDPLLQRLKELDRDKFEGLVFMMLRERYPSANIHRVNGAGGDDGVDTFTGNLSGGCTVWQAKSFANGIRASQREQIKDSLRRVVDSHHPARWVLCTSVDLDITTHAWFQELTAAHASTIAIELLDGSAIAGEVLQRKAIRDYYFPDLGLNVSALRALATKTEDHSAAELKDLTEENAQQYLERFSMTDERFRYELVVSPEQQPKPAPHSAFSMQQGSTLINAFPRDVQALRDDPVHVHFRVRDTGVEKLQEYLRTGRATEFTMDEIVSVRTPLAFPEFDRPLSFQLGTRSSTTPFHCRVTFGVPPTAVVYEHITFRMTRLGTDEAELTSEGKLPFTLTFVVRAKRGQFTSQEALPGAPIAAVKKYADALLALQTGGRIELYDLDGERTLARYRTGEDAIPVLDDSMLRLVTDIARVAAAFGAPVVLPEYLTADDAFALRQLIDLLDGTMPTVGNITIELLNDDAVRSWAALVAAGDGNPGVRQVHPGMTVFFAGVPIPTGPFEIFVDRVRFPEPDQALEAVRTTPVDTPVTLTVLPISTPRARRCTVA